MLSRLLIPFSTAIILSSCATIMEGRSQEIAVNTNPPGAECTLYRNGKAIGLVPDTPGSALIEKSKDDITIACIKKGYQETTYINHSGTAGATAGNIIAGGLIGWGIDSATGADNKYQSPVNITLVSKHSN